MASSTKKATPAPTGDELAAALIALGGLLVLATWSGAQLSTLLTTGHLLNVGVGHGFRAAFNLLSTASEPADAWPEEVRHAIPGPFIYWTTTVVVAGLELVAAFWLLSRVFSYRVGSERRERLGVSTNARMARLRDLRTLIVRGPVSGRLILGTVDGRLVATENRLNAPSQGKSGSSDPRQGDRSAVAVVGPQRSGKTANVISGILDWDGPAILSSVREDLFSKTIANRSTLGTVYVFDPFRELGELGPQVVRVGWSPLARAGNTSGAMEAASVLLEAAPVEGTTNATYWSKKGEALLWPILYAAAVGDRTMADVVRWLALQDGAHAATDEDDEETEEKSGEVRSILREVITNGSNADSIQAQHALAQFDGFWELDPRTRSDIYSTSQTLVQPWEDPRVSFASSPDIGPTIDLQQLLADRNTLYVVQPLRNALRYSVVFGGLLGSLLKDQAYQASHHYGGPLPDLLFVVDEAGNTPLQWLPSVASTCSGIGVLLVTVWQSKAQIDAIYQKQADPLITNHGTKIFFAGISDEATLRYVSYLTGEEEVAHRTSSAEVHLGSGRRSIGDATTHRRLLPAELLRQVRPGEGLLVHGTLPPAHITGRRYWEDVRLSRLASGQIVNSKPWSVDAELMSALASDMSPDAEVLAHMPTYDETSARARSPESSLEAVPASGQPRPLGWGLDQA